MAHARLIAASTALALLLSACSGPAPEPPKPPPGPSASVRPAPLPTLGAGSWGEVASPRFGLEIPLPDGNAWVIDDHTGSWLVARHPGTHSELALRTWREEGVATRRRCEEDARVRRALPTREGADLVADRSINVPLDFDTHVEVGVVAPLPGSSAARALTGIHGFVLAFGGKSHRCFAYAFTTHAEGPGAEQAVGERLATMTQGSLGKVRLKNDLEPPREPMPEGSPAALSPPR